MAIFDESLLQILICPACRDDKGLTYNKDRQKLICYPCKKAYPIIDGIPIMLIDKAESMET